MKKAGSFLLTFFPDTTVLIIEFKIIRVSTMLFLNRRGGSLSLVHANKNLMQNRLIKIDFLDFLSFFFLLHFSSLITIDSYATDPYVFS